MRAGSTPTWHIVSCGVRCSISHDHTWTATAGRPSVRVAGQPHGNTHGARRAVLRDHGHLLTLRLSPAALVPTRPPDAVLPPPVSQQHIKPFDRSLSPLSRSSMVRLVARDMRAADRCDIATLSLAGQSVHTAARCGASTRQQELARRVYASSWRQRGAGRRRRRTVDEHARARRRRSSRTSCRPRGVRLLSPYG